ncbi:MAG: IS1634 family transposase [Candidatus Eisenbacteria bacterium]|nr:IS1634 family transposase [Candidatus Eisenbacteria bacterium]
MSGDYIVARMRRRQAPKRSSRRRPALRLEIQRLGPLPLVNHLLARLDLERLLERFVPTRDRRCALPYARALGVLLRSIVVEREPIYRQQETVSTFTPEAFGLEPAQARRLRDDQIGRALDRLFDADRGSLLTAVVLKALQGFDVSVREVHNDTTSIRFTGQYRIARGRSLRGRRAPWITYGHSKDHRPDLKQLLFILSSTEDGGVPVQFRCADGSTNDGRTHLASWEALCRVAGRTDFLYVADSKLCTPEAMDGIDRKRGRFVTVLPRTRREDQEFRRWIQTHEPAWEEVWNRPHPRRQGGPRDIWRVFRYPLPSREGWPVIWVWSSLLALRHQQGRRERLARAAQELEVLARRLKASRSRLRSQREIRARVDRILRGQKVQRYLRVRVRRESADRYVQATRGRPGPKTRYRRIPRQRFRLEWRPDEAAIAYDRKSDGMYPLLTNERELSSREVLEAHKRQPQLEKRFEQLKNIHEIAPVFLKNEGRIEALFFLYFLGLLVQALLEREVRRGMQKAGIRELPLYPEERQSRRPTAEQVLRLFNRVERHHLYSGKRCVQVFNPQLTELQRQILRLLGVSRRAYCKR